MIVGEDGAVQLMKVWPFGVALRGRLQTASCCAGRETGVVSDEEKAPVRRQVGTRKANVSGAGDAGHAPMSLLLG